MTTSTFITPSGDSDSEDGADLGVGGGQVQTSGVDDILDDIDAVLETNAAAFVQGFVQKGGQ